jgi:4-aminobutyrate aminotransferase-like enzyme
MRERGVLISRIGLHDNILKIRPPMPFSTQHADLLVDTLDQVLASL